MHAYFHHIKSQQEHTSTLCDWHSIPVVHFDLKVPRLKLPLFSCMGMRRQGCSQLPDFQILYSVSGMNVTRECLNTMHAWSLFCRKIYFYINSIHGNNRLIFSDMVISDRTCTWLRAVFGYYYEIFDIFLNGANS